MELQEITGVSAQIARTRSRSRKIALLAECLRRLRGEDVRIGVHYLAGRLPQGRIGVGYALLRDATAAAGSGSATGVTLGEVDAVLAQCAQTTGAGSQRARRELLAALFRRCLPGERDFLIRLLVGELRQGALEGLMVEAVAQASRVPTDAVRRAVMVAGAVASVAEAVLSDGSAGLRRFALTPMHPVRPMLAQTALDVDDALARLDGAILEYKLDGARVQVHKQGSDVRVFTRSLHDATSRVPELVEAVRRFPTRALILDGEVLALRESGRPYPFQTTMSRFVRQKDVERQREHLPLRAFFFDCLHMDGEDLIEHPGWERLGRLEDVVAPDCIIPHRLTDDPDEARRFLAEALEAGHEGIMAKHPEASYSAGNRGSAWLKVKQAHTLDLVVLAAEWGHGRRRGWLSNLHLGVRDPESSHFVMLGKTFKGLTDRMLEWQTQRLIALEIGRDDHTVYVQPKLVVEVAYNDVQTSPHYPGGLALRFARVKRYRLDKPPEEADTIDTVHALHTSQYG